MLLQASSGDKNAYDILSSLAPMLMDNIQEYPAGLIQYLFDNPKQDSRLVIIEWLVKNIITIINDPVEESLLMDLITSMEERKNRKSAKTLKRKKRLDMNF